MTFNIITFAALVLGLYLLYEVDDRDSKSSKIIYTFAGLIAVFWSLVVVLGGYNIQISFMPLAFALFGIASIYTEGAARAFSGAIAFILFLAILY